MQSLIERGDCSMRHENGNCTVAGGFCTAVNGPICEALHNAYDCGRRSVLEEIVHCKDCVHFDIKGEFCSRVEYSMSENDFCGYGERAEE